MANTGVTTSAHAPLAALPADTTRAEARTRRSIGRGSILGVALVAVFVVGTLMSSTFLSTSNLTNVMLNVSILGVLALGQTHVMLLREVDLSMGAMMAFAPISAIQLTEQILSWSGTQLIEGETYVVTGTALIIVLTIVVGAIMGLLNGLITVKGRVPSLIVTLGMLHALRGASYDLSGGHPLYLTDLEGFMQIGTAQVLGFVPVTFLVFLGIGVAAILVLRYTKVGPAMYATGGNEKGAVYSGVKTGRWKTMAFVMAGFCSGVAALFYSSRLGSVEPAQASGYELSAIAIAVVGGTTLEGGRGTIGGTMVGAVVLSVVLNIMTLEGVRIWYQTVITGLIIIAAAFAYLRVVRSAGRGR